jgi:hypothetical protein
MQGRHRNSALLGVAFLLKSWFHSTVLLHVTVRVIPFSVIAFWVLLGISSLWLSFAGFAFVVHIRR